jgi:cytochrome c oxidase cbb3-type subunit 3
MSSRYHDAVLSLAFAAALAGCEREMRRFDTPPYAPSAATVPPLTSHQAGPESAWPVPGAASAAAVAASAPSYPVELNAFAVSQGKRWFRWYNCNGCHANGGGDKGPALMDARWLYGHEPQQIVQSIQHGRPNGMPAFAGRIPDEQLWQLAAYIRSMSGLLRADVLPSRADALSPGEPEVRRDPLPPRQE